MNSEIQVFQYSQTQTMDVRMVMQDGEPWWVLADVCQVLELVNPSKVAERLDDDEKNTLTLSEGIRGRGNPNVTIINESGLYSVILRSDKPQAKAFKRWVTHEVLPSIRRTGSYNASFRPARLPFQTTVIAEPPMPPATQTLWFALLRIDQEQGGTGIVAISNRELMALMGVSSHHTLTAARKRLVEAGYIEVSSGVKAHPSTYTIKIR